MLYVLRKAEVSCPSHRPRNGPRSAAESTACPQSRLGNKDTLPFIRGASRGAEELQVCSGGSAETGVPCAPGAQARGLAGGIRAQRLRPRLRRAAPAATPPVSARPRHRRPAAPPPPRVPSQPIARSRRSRRAWPRARAHRRRPAPRPRAEHRAAAPGPPHRGRPRAAPPGTASALGAAGGRRPGARPAPASPARPSAPPPPARAAGHPREPPARGQQ